MKILLPLFLICLLFAQCKSDNSSSISSQNLSQNDPKAITIADQSMHAMGGLDKWNATRYIAWDFFGARNLIWDKWTGRVRIDSPKDSTIYLININAPNGRVMQRGNEIDPSPQLDSLIERGKSIWINDSYWLVMPFKLKDPGVTLRYVREDTTSTGLSSDVLSLTFDNVGVTPENKYEVFVDKKDHLVKEWAFFEKADQITPSATWPWDNYKNHNGLLLSSDRSDNKGPRKVKVMDDLNKDVFEDFQLPDIWL